MAACQRHIDYGAGAHSVRISMSPAAFPLRGAHLLHGSQRQTRFGEIYGSRPQRLVPFHVPAIAENSTPGRAEPPNGTLLDAGSGQLCPTRSRDPANAVAGERFLQRLERPSPSTRPRSGQHGGLPPAYCRLLQRRRRGASGVAGPGVGAAESSSRGRRPLTCASRAALVEIPTPSRAGINPPRRPLHAQGPACARGSGSALVRHGG